MNTYPLPECESDRGFDLEGSEAHATRGCDGGQKGCESGYYDLHRYLDYSLFHVPLFLFWHGFHGFSRL